MVNSEGYGRYSTSCAGLISGPAAWAVSTQLNYVLAPWQCANGLYLVPWIALGLAVFAALGGAISLRQWRNESAGASLSFAAAVAALISALFTLVIVMQGFAGVIFSGCER